MTIHPTPMRRLLRKLDKTWASLFSLDQWIVMAARDLDFRNLEWSAFHPLIPQKDRYWGDPFVVAREGAIHVFVEEKMYATDRGHISCLTLDTDGRLVEHRVVLESDEHMSYPFIFEHAGETYMLPETAARRTVEVFRCTHFPDRWEHAATLMQDIYAVDSTLLKHQGRFWLFSNVRERGGSSLNALHLFWSEDPLSASWTAHPGNPVVHDLGSARPAGAIFYEDGVIVRPAQDSTRRYGGALKFQQITALEEDRYAERTLATFAPPPGRFKATHTFNRTAGWTVIDAVLRRAK
jgi:hypothetical protein